MSIVVIFALLVIVSIFIYKKYSSPKCGIEALKGGRYLFDGMPKEKILRWFFDSDPWNRVNARFLEVIVNHFYKDPRLDIFVVDLMKRSENIDLINAISIHPDFKKACGRKNVENTMFLHLLYKLYCKKAIVLINMLSKIYHNDKNGVQLKKNLVMVYPEIMDYLDIASMVSPNTLQPYILKVRLLYQAGLFEKAAGVVNEGCVKCESKYVNARKEQFIKWDEESKTFDYLGYVKGDNVQEVNPLVGHRLLTEFLINWDKLC